MSNLEGKTLRWRYPVEELIGRGGMSEVYRAWDTRRQYHVAIKVMREDLAEDIEFLGRFQREAHALAALSHANIVRFYSFERQGALAFIVMDYVQGTTLRRRIMEAGGIPLPMDEVLSITGQVCAALHYAHQKGVIHRDVKPQNVIIRLDGQAVLVDFGLVKLWDPDDPQIRTVMHGLGTPEYAPPEQYHAQPGHTGPPSDIYSLGATIYHALTGQAPPTASQRMANPEGFQSLRKLDRRIAPTTEPAVVKAMEQAMKKRFATAEEMAPALNWRQRRLLSDADRHKNAWAYCYPYDHIYSNTQPHPYGDAPLIFDWYTPPDRSDNSIANRNCYQVTTDAATANGVANAATANTTLTDAVGTNTASIDAVAANGATTDTITPTEPTPTQPPLPTDPPPPTDTPPTAYP